MKSTVAIANNSNKLNLKATNYPLNAQVPTTKLNTEITSEPSKITQLLAGYLSQLKRKLGRNAMHLQYNQATIIT
jgi:hypothetical protein